MINDIVDSLNEFLPLPLGAKIYGIAQSVVRDEGDRRQLIPCLVDKNGEGEYIGIDNTLPAIIYHKCNSIQVTEVGKAIGDNRSDIKNTYSNVMIVYLDRRKTGQSPDEILIKIQNVFPELIKMAPYKNIVIRILNVILNSTQVWASEYQNTDYLLPPEANLFAINYQIESTFKKGCFDKCT